MPHEVEHPSDPVTSNNNIERTITNTLKDVEIMVDCVVVRSPATLNGTETLTSSYKMPSRGCLPMPAKEFHPVTTVYSSNYNPVSLTHQIGQGQVTTANQPPGLAHLLN